MIRLLFLIQSLPIGGTESALYNLLSRLDMSKFDVTVYMYWAGGGYYDKFKELEDSRGIKLKKMFNDIKPANHFTGKLKNYFLLHVVEPNKFLWPKIFYKTAIEGQYDVEVAYSFFGTPIIIAASPNNASKKVAWIHGDMSTNNWCLKHYRSRKAQAENYNKFDRIVCVSETVKNGFIKVLGESPALTVLHNPVNTEYIKEKAFEPIEKGADFVDENTVCAVGRLSEEKGYGRLIKIHKQLLDEGVWHKLVIVGDGTQKRPLEQLISDLHVSDTVMLIGYDLNPYRYISRCKFLVCSSYSEGLPVVVQEALALGKPIVSSHSSAEELFEGKICGIVSTSDDQALKGAIRKMFTDKPFYENCLENARAVGSKIEYDSMVAKVEYLFENLVKT